MVILSLFAARSPYPACRGTLFEKENGKEARKKCNKICKFVKIRPENAKNRLVIACKTLANMLS